MALHVIVGAGPVGTTLAHQLADAGHEVRVVTRSGGGPERTGVRRVRADASDAVGLARHATGAAALYNCANPPSYELWAAQWPPLAAAMLAAAERTGAVLVTTGNLYGYGPVGKPISRDHPLAAVGAKGRLRADMWRDALAAHEAGRVRVTEVRASDYVGPGLGPANGLLARYAEAVLKERTVYAFGDPDAPHSFSYVPDVARTLAAVAADERAWGQAWHVPSPPATSVRQALTDLAAAARVRPPRLRRVPRALLRPLHPFVPVLRELDEVLYQWERPFVIDAAVTTAVLGLRATPWEQVVRDTVGRVGGAR
jgi:nucleoside-diphosphate-sugar epimerase